MTLFPPSDENDHLFLLDNLPLPLEKCFVLLMFRGFCTVGYQRLLTHLTTVEFVCKYDINANCSTQKRAQRVRLKQADETLWQTENLNVAFFRKKNDIARMPHMPRAIHIYARKFYRIYRSFFVEMKLLFSTKR